MKTSWMKFVVAAVVAAALAGAPAGAQAAGAGKGAAKKAQRQAQQPLRGRIVSVSGKAGNVKLVVHSGGKKNPHDVTVQADLDTKVTLDGKAAQASDLKPGERVTVTPANGTAKTIVATGKPAKAAKGEGKAARAKATRAKAARA